MNVTFWVSQEKAEQPLSLEEVTAQASLGSVKAVKESLKAAADAQYRLITCNMALVKNVVSNYKHMGSAAYEDLVLVRIPAPASHLSLFFLTAFQVVLLMCHRPTLSSCMF